MCDRKAAAAIVEVNQWPNFSKSEAPGRSRTSINQLVNMHMVIDSAHIAHTLNEAKGDHERFYAVHFDRSSLTESKYIVQIGTNDMLQRQAPQLLLPTRHRSHDPLKILSCTFAKCFGD